MFTLISSSISPHTAKRNSSRLSQCRHRTHPVELLQTLTLTLCVTSSVLAEIVPEVIPSSELLPLPTGSAGGNASEETLRRHMELFSHFHESYDRRVFGQLSIYGIDVSPSSLTFGWSLTNRTFVDGSLEASVICETYNGRMVSDKLHPSADTFEFRHLSSSTNYTICVYMLERSLSSESRVLHYQCAPFRTIPVMRPDSMLGVALTLGYIFLMALIGYLTWFWRRSKMRKRREYSSQVSEEDEDKMARVKILPRGGEDEGYRATVNGNTELDDDDGDSQRPGCSGFSRKSATSRSEPALNGSFSNYKKRGSQSSLSALCSRGQKEEYLIHYNVKEREITF